MTVGHVDLEEVLKRRRRGREGGTALLMWNYLGRLYHFLSDVRFEMAGAQLHALILLHRSTVMKATPLGPHCFPHFESVASGIILSEIHVKNKAQRMDFERKDAELLASFMVTFNSNAYLSFAYKY